MRSARAKQPDYQTLEEAERKGNLPQNSSVPVSPFLGRPNLSKKQTDFLTLFSANPFIPINQLCKLAGTTPRTVAKWRKNSEPFQRAMVMEHRRSQQVVNMSRKSVMRGLLEAIDMAKDQCQSNSMISGWKEIGRMCGFYEPERREVLLSVNSQDLIEEMKSLPRDKLLELASDQDIVDVEYTVMDT